MRKKRYEEEAICFHCGSKLIAYRRTFCRFMVPALIMLYERRGDRSVRLSDLPLTPGQRNAACHLAYWNLAEPVVDRETEAQRGWWRITEEGVDFVEGRSKIYKHAIVKRRAVMRYEPPSIGIRDADPKVQVYQDFAEQAISQISGSQGRLFDGSE